MAPEQLPKTIAASTQIHWRAKLASAAVGLLLASACQAKLGGDRASVLADQTAWGASSSQALIGSASGATVFTLTLGNGLNVRQYVDASGCVFAVAWDGPVLPDFVRLLGDHFADYADAQRQQKRGVNVQNASLVIESGGMMRSFGGRAYLPAKLPTTLTVQDIR